MSKLRESELKRFTIALHAGGNVMNGLNIYKCASRNAVRADNHKRWKCGSIEMHLSAGETVVPHSTFMFHGVGWN